MESRYEYGGPGLPEAPVKKLEEEDFAAGPKVSKTGKKGLHLGGRMLLCSAVFLALFGLRALSPELGEKINKRLLPLINGGWDYREALEAVGSLRAEEGLEAVAALFQQPEQSQNACADGPASKAASRQLVQSLQHRQTAAQEEAGEADGTDIPAEETAAEAADTPDVVAAFLESQSAYAEQSMPENASFAMPELGLACAAPVTAPVTDSFGWRMHPLQGQVKFHYGVDIGAAEGSKIGAFADGTVSAVGDSTSLGLYVILEHENGVQTEYAHCSEILVQPGDSVTAGQAIARVGRSGAVTGAHLHLELRQDGVYLNPAYYADLEGNGG